MYLAGCLKEYEEDVICDLAEVYGIYDYKTFKMSYIAVLVKGLSEESRLKIAIRGDEYTRQDLYMCSIIDILNLLLWSKTKDGSKNRNKPKSLTSMLSKKSQNNVKSFTSSEEFEKQKNRIIKGV